MTKAVWAQLAAHDTKDPKSLVLREHVGNVLCASIPNGIAPHDEPRDSRVGLHKVTDILDPLERDATVRQVQILDRARQQMQVFCAGITYSSVPNYIKVCYFVGEHRKDVANGPKSSTLAGTLGSAGRAYLQQDGFELLVIELLKAQMNETFLWLDVWFRASFGRHCGVTLNKMKADLVLWKWRWLNSICVDSHSTR